MRENPSDFESDALTNSAIVTFMRKKIATIIYTTFNLVSDRVRNVENQ